MKRLLPLLLVFLSGLSFAATPTVESSTSGIENDGAWSTFDIDMPATVTADAVLIACVSIDNAATFTWDTTTYGTWTKLFESRVNSWIHLECHAILADGDEDSGSITVTPSSSLDAAWFSYSVINWENDTVANGVDGLGVVGGGNDANPDPPSNAVAWGSTDSLVIAVYGWDTAVGLTSHSSGFSGNAIEENTSGSFPASIAAATAAQSTDPYNPGTATISASRRWGAGTIVIEGSDTTALLRRRR